MRLSSTCIAGTTPNPNGRFDAGEAGVLVARAGRGRDLASIDPALRAPSTDEFVIGIERALGAADCIVRAAQSIVSNSRLSGR